MDEERLERARKEAIEQRTDSRDFLDSQNIQQLHTLTAEQLIARHDLLLEEARERRHYDPPGAEYFLDRAQAYLTELSRREAVRQGERMEALTRSLNRLTWVITIATIIGVALTAWALLSGG